MLIIIKFWSFKIFKLIFWKIWFCGLYHCGKCTICSLGYNIL